MRLSNSGGRTIAKEIMEEIRINEYKIVKWRCVLKT